jgi:hypothetical protein
MLKGSPVDTRTNKRHSLLLLEGYGFQIKTILTTYDGSTTSASENVSVRVG